jgi:hypothetical protein
MRRGLTVRMRRRLVSLSCASVVMIAGLGLAVAAPGPVGARPLASAPHCTILPADNAFNQRVDRLPVAPGSARLIAAIGIAAPVHPDFGSGTYAGAPIGIPITVVSRHTHRVRVRFMYALESDRGPYPIPAHPAIEGGPASTGDRHILLLDRDSCRDYELYAAYPAGQGRWRAGSGAIFNLRSDHLRPAGWTSADAAGLPILPGLARYDEVAGGSIDHALRFTAPCSGARYVYPARHLTSGTGCAGGVSPPMGLRVRLKAGVNLAGLPYQARIVAQALKRYGMILADNGSPWYISGAPDRRWNNSDFEVVNTASLPHPGT